MGFDYDQTCLYFSCSVVVGLYVTKSLCLSYYLFRDSFWKCSSLTLITYQQLCSLLLLCKILSHFKSLTPSKSMPQKRNQDFHKKCSYIREGTLEPMRITNINRFFAVHQRFRIRVRLMMTWYLAKR